MSARLWVAPAAVSEEAAPEAVPVQGPESRVQGPEGGVRDPGDEVPDLEDVARELDQIGVPEARGLEVSPNPAATTRNRLVRSALRTTYCTRRTTIEPPYLMCGQVRASAAAAASSLASMTK